MRLMVSQHRRSHAGGGLLPSTCQLVGTVYKLCSAATIRVINEQKKERWNFVI